MNIFSLFTFAGGLGLFLFGMKVLGEAIARQAGGPMKAALERITASRLAAVLLGTGVTAVIQSSGATTVMVLGFINSGIMTLENSVGLILGANIGTTATAWLLALNDISGDSLVLRLLNPDSFVPVLAFVGAVLLVFCKGDRVRDAGTILLGFSVLMFGMGAMSDAMSPLRDSSLFRSILTALDNPLLGLVAGFAMSAVLQSSSASVGIVQAAAITGVVTISNALPLIMGINIGAGLIVLFAASGANRDAHRAAWLYVLYNIIVMALFMIPLLILEGIGGFAFLEAPITAFEIAILHTGYKTAGVLAQLPFIPLILRLTGKIVRPRAEEQAFAMLDDNLLINPPIAVDRCRALTNEMAELAEETLRLAVGVVRSYDVEKAKRVRELEKRIDVYEDKIGNFLVHLSSRAMAAVDSREVTKLLHGISDFERISDHARNVMDSGEELHRKELSFTETGRKEMDVMFRAVEHTVELAVRAFREEDDTTARRIEPLEQVVDDLRNELRDRHIDRLRRGECSTTLGFVFTDLLTDLERISDHCSNVAVTVLQMRRSSYEPHRYEARLKASDKDFNRLYDEYTEEYRV